MSEGPRSLEELVRPHIDSFDHFIGEGLQSVVENLKPVEVHQTSLTCSELLTLACTSDLSCI
jgi:DNA-directed RNA polymerase beta subunit